MKPRVWLSRHQAFYSLSRNLPECRQTFSASCSHPCSFERLHVRLISVTPKREPYERFRNPSTRLLSEDSRAVAPVLHWSDRNRNRAGWAPGPGGRITDTVGMFELYRCCSHPLCRNLRGMAARPDRGTPREVARTTRDRRSLTRSAQSPDLHECRTATSTGTPTRYRTSGPSPLRVPPCRTQLFLG